MNPVSISGIGILTPLLNQPEDILSLAEKGFPFPGSEISGVISIPGIDPKEIRQMSKLTRMALYSAVAARGRNAELSAETGIYFGITHGSTSYLKKFHDYLFDYGPDLASPLMFSAGVSNAPLSAISSLLKIQDGGMTYVGVEHTGLDVLNEAASSIAHGLHDTVLAGAAEEYSDVVEGVYQKMGCYSEIKPQYLPCPSTQRKMKGSFRISEASLFFKLEKSPGKTSEPDVYYSPLDDAPEFEPDLVISSAGGFLADRHALRVLKAIFSKFKNPKPLLFSKPLFGENFAPGSLIPVFMACSIFRHHIVFPFYPAHPAISKFSESYSPEKVRKILVLSTGQDGIVKKGAVFLD